MRLGTRRSALALAQAELVAAMLGNCEIVPIATSGDRGAREGEKSRWVAELEQALAAGAVDIAVHSAKDLPGELAAGLELLGTPPRAGGEDALCGASALERLEPGARVGTSSIRRTAQLRAAREDLDVVPLRGNVDTRLAALARGDRDLDAIVLARAGLQRLGREAELGCVLDPARFVPAPGQGAIALEGREGESSVSEAVSAICDEADFARLRAERALAGALEASCHTPLGAAATVTAAGALALRAWVGLPDGSAWVCDELTGELSAPEELGRRLGERMVSAGAAEMLSRAEEMAGVGGA